MAAANRRRGPLQELLSGNVQQGDATFQVGRDETAADGMNHVLVQRLQTQQFSAAVVKLPARLPQLGCEGAGKMRHGQVGEQVDQNHGLKRIQVAARGGLESRKLLEVVQLQDAPKEYGGDAGRHVGPVTRQENAGDDNHQGI